MSTKQFGSRIINKHDTEANWNLTSGFVPYIGEIIVYDIDASHTVPRIKVGDGVTDVKQLPFLIETAIDAAIGNAMRGSY